VVHVCDHDRRLAERWRLVDDATPRRVIYNGVDASRLPRPEPARPRRGVFVGRLVPQKDPPLIAEIAARLAAAGTAVAIVGGGPGEPEVRRRLRRELASGTVRMTGSADHARALDELARASVLVLPSRWEGLPVVLLEALALGVPAVAAAVGGVPEIVRDGATGVLVEGRDPAAFAAAATRLLSDREACRRLAAAGRALVNERFRLADCVARYLSLYDQAG
jgi:glycosyltransferase involved in cell wall biosynthesis